MTRRRVLAAAALLAVLPFLPALRNGFVNYDDTSLILGNPFLRGLTLLNLGWMLSTFAMTSYQPLGWLLYALLAAAAGGFSAPCFHAASLALHGLNAALLCALIWGLRRDKGAYWPLACLLGATAWAWHPLQAESVAWATELPDLLASSLALLSLNAYLRHASGPGSRRALAAAAVLFLLSGLARWKAVSLPFLLVLIDAHAGRLGRRGVWREKLPFAAIALVLFLVNWKAKSLGPEYRWALTPEGAGLQVLFYLRKLAAPGGLYPLYTLARPEESAWLGPAALTAAAATAGLAWLSRRRPAALLLWASFLAGLAPTLAFTLRGAWRPADHFFYLASFALAPALAGALAAAHAAGRGRTAAAAACAWLLVLGALSWRQTMVWRTSESLWSHALRLDPAHPIARGDLAVALYEDGRPADAAAQFRRQAAEHPEDARAAHAAESLEAALSRPEARPAAFDSDLGASLMRQGRLDEASAALERAIAAEPSNAPAWMNLAQCLALQGREAEAERIYERAKLLAAPPPRRLR